MKKLGTCILWCLSRALLANIPGNLGGFQHSKAGFSCAPAAGESQRLFAFGRQAPETHGQPSGGAGWFCHKDSKVPPPSHGPGDRLVVARGVGVGGLGEKGEGIKKHKLVVTEQSWGGEVQRREYRR